MSENEKDNCRVENNVIEGGEDEVTKSSNQPKKRTHAIKKKNNTKYPIPAILQKSTASRRPATMTTKTKDKGEDKDRDKVSGSSSIEWKDSDIDTLIALDGGKSLNL